MNTCRPKPLPVADIRDQFIFILRRTLLDIGDSHAIIQSFGIGEG